MKRVKSHHIMFRERHVNIIKELTYSGGCPVKAKPRVCDDIHVSLETLVGRVEQLGMRHLTKNIIVSFTPHSFGKWRLFCFYSTLTFQWLREERSTYAIVVVVEEEEEEEEEEEWKKNRQEPWWSLHIHRWSFSP